MIGVARGMISSVAFIAVAMLIAPEFKISPTFMAVLLLTCLTLSLPGVLAALLAKTHQDLATFSSRMLLPMTFIGATLFSLSQ